MSMSASGMAAKIKAAVDAVAKESNLGGAEARRNAITLALCQGIIDEITANAQLVPVTTDSDGAIVTGKVL